MVAGRLPTIHVVDRILAEPQEFDGMPSSDGPSRLPSPWRDEDHLLLRVHDEKNGLNARSLH